MNCFRRPSGSQRCTVVLLDGQELTEEIQDATFGQDLLDMVLRHLGLQETAYFGLRYMHASRQPHWLHPSKKILKQLKGAGSFTLYFCVKHYATDPCKLRDELTRYQFFLQVKKDIVDGRLPTPPELADELAGYVAQSDLGDYDASLHKEGYCQQFQLSPSHSASEKNIAQLHKSLVGQCPAAVEAAFLEKVRWLDLYGADLYPVMGEDSFETFVGLAPSGVLVLRGKRKVDKYFWPRITKVLCKRKSLVIRTRDNDNEERTLSFECTSRLACQLLLQNCADQQEFFRQAMTNPSGGSSARSGRSDGRRGLSAPPSQRQRGRREVAAGPNDHAAKASSKLDGDMTSTSAVCLKTISVPQPVQSASSLYQSNPVNMEAKPCPDSPKSVHSAALSASQLPGLFNARPLTKTRSRTSMDSQSSVDSRTQRRSRHRREPSAGSDVSSGQSSLRSSRRYRGRRAESGSDSDRSGGSRRHRSRRHRHQSGTTGTELIDSEPQWREVQRLQAERLRPSGYQNSGMETETELSYQPKRRVKRHSRSRSRSRSPETCRNRRLPAELRRHLQFGLVEPSADSAADIPYTKVTTEHRLPRIRYAAKRSQKGSVDGRSDAASEPPPPPLPSSPSQDVTPEGALPPTAEYPGMTAGVAGAYTSTSAGRPTPTARYPAAATEGLPAPPAPRSAAYSTLSSYYVRTSSGERARDLVAATDKLPPSPAGSVLPVLTSGQLTRPADTQYDNSDSGLGNESPTEFTRSMGQSPSVRLADPRTVTSPEQHATRKQDVITSL